MKIPRFRRTAFLVIAALALSAPAALAAETPLVPPIGVIGDSYSDEYRFHPPRSHARNWVELLHRARGLHFGRFSAGRRTAPRSRGFLFDFAHAGLTSDEALGEGYADGLAQEVIAGAVGTVVIFIGGNDFVDAVLDGDDAKSPDEIAAGVLQNLLQIVETLKAAGNAHLIVATIPRPTLLPVLKNLIDKGIVSDDEAASLDEAVASLNENLKNSLGAADDAVEIADLALATEHATTRKALVVGGVTIRLGSAANRVSSLFLADGLHLGTVGQGLLANVFLRAINAANGSKFGACRETR